MADASANPSHASSNASLSGGASVMPYLFRLTSIRWELQEDGGLIATATIFHEAMQVRVSWTARTIEKRLAVGCIVSPRWLTYAATLRGATQIARLVPYTRAEAACDLFALVPHGWVRDRELVRAAQGVIDSLPKAFRHLFNAIFWDGGRFRRFCTVPSSIRGHHNDEHGNLRHAVDVAASMIQLSAARTAINPGLAALCGLIHDAGKADEYCLGADGQWILSDRGRLLGHRVTIIEWIAEALAAHQVPMADAHRLAIVHCLTANANAPEWMGVRTPAMIEAMMLSGMDRLSGIHDLWSRCAAETGWGKYHEHLRGRAYSLDPVSKSVR